MALKGNKIKVSQLSPDEIYPLGTSAYEKRGVAIAVPEWNPDKCIECCHCSFVCPHAAIRPFLATAEELKNVPETFVTKEAKGEGLNGLKFRIQTYSQDCYGCGSCVLICPGKALTLKPFEQQVKDQIINLDFAEKNISIKDDLVDQIGRASCRERVSSPV